MNYKRILKNQTTRLAMLRALSFIPDAIMLRLQYWIKTGHKLNLRACLNFA